MNFTVRKAKISDCFALQYLNSESMGYDHSIQKTEENLKNTLCKEYECVFVAECEDSVVGYIHACDYCLIFSEPMVNVLGLAVDSRFYRQGIGAALMKAAEEWAKSRGAKGIRLVSGETRLGAHAFYEKCGYKSNKTQKNFKKMF